MSFKNASLFCLFALLIQGCAMLPVREEQAPAEITFASLLRELTDLDRLADYPDPPYICRQFSSYDRRSVDPAILTDANWMANGDRGHFIRVDEKNGEKEFVLMDVAGPGAIVRFWSANPTPGDAGDVRVYLDGAEQPTIEMPLAEMLGGGPGPFVGGICGERSRGWNCYLPIPYAKHCKVTSTKGNYYYQINYRTYADGAPVVTYAPEQAAACADAVTTLGIRLADPVGRLYAGLLPTREVHEWPIEARLDGYHALMIPLDGPERAIYRLACKVKAKDLEAALRGCLLEIHYDGQSLPAVQAPLGDFFGTAPGANPFNSLPCAVLEDGTLISNWVMPFQKSATIRLSNHTADAMTFDLTITTAAREWTADTMYLHAKWRTEKDIPSHPHRDWNYVNVNGRGVYLGNMLHITNSDPAWWGEGDEKIYFDGEKFPSIFGTGTEDYYGYAWCNNQPFTHAYHNQPRCDGPRNYGQTCNSRFHVIDALPFTESLRFDMEIWHWKSCTMSISAVSWWYAQPGATDNREPLRGRMLYVPQVPEIKIRKVQGALEGESLKVLSKTGGKVEKQAAGAWNPSGGFNLFWRDQQVGQTLELGFAAPQAGKYQVYASFLKAADYGIFEIAVNGKRARDQWDLHNNGVIVTPEMLLGTFELKQAGNVLKLTAVGRSQKSKVEKWCLGLDYLLLKPAD